MLYEFYGEECPHCIKMHSLIERLEKELRVKVKKREVWHNKEHEKLMQKYDRGYCGGVPFFYNDSNEKWICGETSYEELKKWAQ